jgi:hypothetical protein
LVLIFLAFGIVPLLTELAVANNWHGIGANNRWFYFNYFLTITAIEPLDLIEKFCNCSRNSITIRGVETTVEQDNE